MGFHNDKLILEYELNAIVELFRLKSHCQNMTILF